MPSILSKYGSEPVSLQIDQDNPYEPPHRAATEKSGRPIQAAKTRLLNGDSTKTDAHEQTLDHFHQGHSDEAIPSSHSVGDGKLRKSTDSYTKECFEDSGMPLKADEDINGSLDEPIHSSQMNGKPRSHTSGHTVSLQQSSINGHRTTETRQGDNHLEEGVPKIDHHHEHRRGHSKSAPHAATMHGAPLAHNDGALPDPAGNAPQQQSIQHLKKPSMTASDVAPTSESVPTSKLYPNAPRLQHRHTLEVPRVSMTGSRTSRDFSHPINTSDTGSDNGRLSPALRTPRASNTMARGPTRSVHSDMYADEVPHDGDMARWTETVRQKRASRRKKKEEDEDDRVVVGTKVDMNHVNWVTAYNMLTGIRFTVSRTNAKIDRELSDADFDAKHKFSFDITGNELTPSAKYDFKFKDYAPWVFRHLRAKFKLDPADYLMSLTSKYILSELGSPGKSGSFFYFSRDYKYIIKTIHHAEHKLLRQILREYYAHVEKYPNTLISQFYGLHRVKIPYGRKIHFVVMNNLFPPHRDIHQTFDLKGSTIGRNFTEENLVHNPRATLKDLNWLRRNNHFEFGPEKKSIFVEQMKRDVALLQKLKIMDYSLLVGIHDLNKGNEENLRDKTLQVFQPGGDGSPEPQINMLTRTPSKLENQRQARQLRQIIKTQKPVPMDKSTSKMPDEILEERKHFIFYSDDGGFRATHEDGQPGEEIYYLGIIDCLTHYGFVKKAEHFWKGLSNDSKQISPIPPEGYGDRFVKFISGLTMTREEAERGTVPNGQIDEHAIMPQSGPNLAISRRSTDGKSSGRKSTDRASTEKIVHKAEVQAEKSQKDGIIEDPRRDRTLGTTRNSSIDRSSANQGAILPVVEEAGESGSREESIRDEKNAAAATQSTTNTEIRQAQIPFTHPSTKDPTLPSIPNFNRLSMGLGAPAPGKAKG